MYQGAWYNNIEGTRQIDSVTLGWGEFIKFLFIKLFKDLLNQWE